MAADYADAVLLLAVLLLSGAGLDAGLNAAGAMYSHADQDTTEAATELARWWLKSPEGVA